MVLQKETQEKQVLEQFLWLKMVEWYNQYLMHLQNLLFTFALSNWFYVLRNLEDISTSWGSWYRY